MKKLSEVNLHIEVGSEVVKAVEDAKAANIPSSIAVLGAGPRRRRGAWAMTDED